MNAMAVAVTDRDIRDTWAFRTRNKIYLVITNIYQVTLTVGLQQHYIMLKNQSMYIQMKTLKQLKHTIWMYISYIQSNHVPILYWNVNYSILSLYL